MQKRGEKTSHPGILRVGKKEYIIRVSMRTRDGKRKEVERRMELPSIQEALKEQLRLQEFLTSSASDGDGGVAESDTTSRETLSDYAKRWLVHVERTGRCRENVIDQRAHMLEQFVLPILGECLLAEVRPRVLAHWMEKLGTMRRADGGQYSQETLFGAWAVLRTMLKDGVMLAGLPYDPTSGFRFQAKGVSAKHKDVLTQEETEAVLSAANAESPDIRAMLWVGFTTGLRFGELSALEWRDVDFERRLIRVERAQTEGVLGPTKTGTNRSVPIKDEVLVVLKAHKAWQEKRMVRGLAAGIVFPSQNGGYRYPAILIKPLRRCCEAATVRKNVTAHTMRRTANNLLRQSSGEIAARAITGHTTQAMTEHYSDVTAAEKLSAQRAAFGDLSSALPNGGDDRWGLPGSGGEKGRLEDSTDKKASDVSEA